MAYALLMLRSLLLLDEVTSELDMFTRCRLFDCLKKEAAGGATVFVCTHVLNGLEGWPMHFLHLGDGAAAKAASLVAIASVCKSLTHCAFFLLSASNS